MNVALKNSFDTGADRRAFGRRETHMAASVRLPNHTLYDCVIRDISEGGALLEFPQRIEVSGRLRLRLEAGSQEIICDVRHTRGNRAGVEFARPIALAARPIVAPADAAALVFRPAAAAAEKGRVRAASELVALRRKAAKILVKANLLAAFEPAPVIIEIPDDAAAPVLPRDISSLIQSAAALATARAGPRPLPASAYALASG